ncbi:tetratricopeptide repeat protein [Fulvivirga lutimaris]|uniref:tetratricopeptide repeat protein n=1 Tax=Fulvivirga lutimaris TaxID=1819566 RepID=UPI0012BCD326|nr:tetratricopeptide repeat protein [Fulvivirga lutimaris]MTI40622.1 tetratricopeptide repeat protein [Fulvivirga lutimaris]
MSKTAQDYFNEATTLCQNKEYKEALPLFSKAINLDGGNLKFRYDRAKAHFKLGQFDASIADFNVLIEKEPNNGYFLSERAVAFHLNKQNEMAMVDLNKAAELEPNKPFRYSSRAYIKERMGDLKGAIEDYERCIALDPDDAIAHNNKGLVEEKLGYKERSKVSFARADELDPNYDKEKIEKSKQERTELNNPQAEEATNVEVSDDKLTVKGYLKSVKSLASDKSERKQFFKFIKQIFKAEN